MRTRTKILIAIAAGILVHILWTYPVHSAHSAEQKVLERDLVKFYADANEAYFQGKLYEDPVIIMDPYVREDWMASTEVRIDGQPTIRFNPKYVVGHRTAYLTMLHEMCHVKVGVMEEHNNLWRACMLEIDQQDAFRKQIIDGYDGVGQ